MSKSSATQREPTQHAFDVWKLLKNYRIIKQTNDDFINYHKERLEENVEALHLSYDKEYDHVEEYLDMLQSIGFNFNDTAIEGHARTVHRTKEMLNIFESAVESLKNHKGGLLLHRMLYHTYLSLPESEAPDTVDEIIDALNRDGEYFSSRMHYYRIRKKAIESLEAILFGSDAMIK